MSSHVQHRFDAHHPTAETGWIAIDEHTSIGCLVHDLSAHGVEIVVPDASIVPEVFMLTAMRLASTKVCHTLWRTDETIAAQFR
ncbi:MAG: PilZ domain-containing protein [Methylorubrum populi]